nr:MAG TPA: hypothetical protein [Caudoviricetes sp.]
MWGAPTGRTTHLPSEGEPTHSYTHTDHPPHPGDEWMLCDFTSLSPSAPIKALTSS